MARSVGSYIPLGVSTRGLSGINPSGGFSRATRGLVSALQTVSEIGTDPVPLLSTQAFDSNGTQRLLDDRIVSLHFAHSGQEIFAHPDREFTGYGANGFWYTSGVLDPAHVPFKATWAEEGEGTPTEDRGSLDRMPQRVIAAATYLEVALFDADTLDLWMRFRIGLVPPPGNGKLVGQPTTRIRSVRLVNGYLVIATNEGLRIADFRQDRGFLLSPSGTAYSATGLVDRNEDVFLDGGWGGGGVLSSDCLCMDAGTFSTSTTALKQTKTVVVVGNPLGIDAVTLPKDGTVFFPQVVNHLCRIVVPLAWSVENDGGLDATSPYFVDGATNWMARGVQRGDRLHTDTGIDKPITLVENITPGRRLSVTPELGLAESGANYYVTRGITAVLLSPEFYLYFADGTEGLAVVRDPEWVTTPGIFSDMHVVSDAVSPLAAAVDGINALVKRGDTLFAATTLGVFTASDSDLDGKRLAGFTYSTPAVTAVDAAYKILYGTDANCEAIGVDPETGDLLVAVTDTDSVVTEINLGTERAFRYFDRVGYVRALAAFRNPQGPPDEEVT